MAKSHWQVPGIDFPLWDDVSLSFVPAVSASYAFTIWLFYSLGIKKG